MPNRRFPPARWVLPDTVHPSASKCFSVPVPDEPYYLAAFQGALQNLASAYKWADDTAHTAKDVASVWRDIIDNISPCFEVPGKLCVSGTFADLDYGWTSEPAADCTSVWAASVGWKSCVNADDKSELWIRDDIAPVSTRILSYRFHPYTGVGNGYWIYVNFYLAGFLQRQDSLHVAAGGGDTITSSTPVDCDAITIDAVIDSAGSHAVIALDDWTICYLGAWPLSNSLMPTIGTFTYDFVTGDAQGWVVWTERPYGHITAGTGWQSDPNQVNNQSIYIEKPVAINGMHLTRFVVRGHISITPTNAGLFYELSRDIYFTPASGDFVLDSGTIDWSLVAPDRVMCNVLITNGAGTGFITITSITIDWLGAGNPLG